MASNFPEDDLQANHPSSSSLLVGAGSGAPGASCVGSCTYPPRPKGLKEDSFDRIGVDEVVVAGTSGVLRDHPNEFMESRNEVEVILSRSATGPTLCPAASDPGFTARYAAWNASALPWTLYQSEALSGLTERC